MKTIDELIPVDRFLVPESYVPHEITRPWTMYSEEERIKEKVLQALEDDKSAEQ